MASQCLSPQSPRLPPELIDLVVDHLYYEKRSLFSVSLVSRALVASAQYHLFSSVHINIGPSEQRHLYPGRTAHESSKDHSSFPAFLDLLLTAPHICTYIRELEVVCVCDYMVEASEAWTRESRDVPIGLHTTAVFVQVLHLLGALHTLSLSDVVLTFFPDLQNDVCPVTSLRHLVLKYTALSSRELVALVSVCFPKDTLVLVETSVYRDGPTEYQFPVKHLNIQGYYHPCDVLSSFEFPNLTELTVDSGKHIPNADEVSFLRFIGGFLISNGPRLEHLRLNLTYLSTWKTTTQLDPIWPPFQLSSVCPALRSLHLRSTTSYGEETAGPISWGAANTAIRVISSAPRTLRSIVFAINITSHNWWPPIRADWQKLSNTLETFPNLTEVTFGQPGWSATSAMSEVTMTIVPWDPKIQTYLGVRFPELNRRGILHFG